VVVVVVVVMEVWSDDTTSAKPSSVNDDQSIFLHRAGGSGESFEKVALDLQPQSACPLAVPRL